GRGVAARSLRVARFGIAHEGGALRTTSMSTGTRHLIPSIATAIPISSGRRGSSTRGNAAPALDCGFRRNDDGVMSYPRRENARAAARGGRPAGASHRGRLSSVTSLLAAQRDLTLVQEL